MNTNQLFEAIGEVDAEKVLRSERSTGKSRRSAIRLTGILAAVVAAVAAMTLIANAATGGAVLNTIRMWFNGERIEESDPRVTVTADEEILFDAGDSIDNEFISAKTDKEQECLYIHRYRKDEDSQALGMTMQVNRVEKRDGRLILIYGGDEIDLTEQLRDTDECLVDYTVSWSDRLETNLLIRVQRDQDGQYLVFTEPGEKAK